MKRGQVVKITPVGPFTVELVGITRSELRAAKLPTMAEATGSATLIPRQRLVEVLRLVRHLGGRAHLGHLDGPDEDRIADQGELW
jgi:hypothetical protein